MNARGVKKRPHKTAVERFFRAKEGFKDPLKPSEIALSRFIHTF
jgi:hypothetical protein